MVQDVPVVEEVDGVVVQDATGDEYTHMIRALVEEVAPEVEADLPGYVLTPTYRLLYTVYGDHIHDNSGTHLD